MTDARTDPPLAAAEADTLLAYLTYHRDTLRLKTSGLDQHQLAVRLLPSAMTLGGLVKHLALVESSWFEEVLAGETLMPPFDTVDWEGDPDWEWRTAADDTPEQLAALFDAAVSRCDARIAAGLATGGLDVLSVQASRRRPGERFSLRWILLHMIEEYARHNGHADLIREAVDGSVGE